MNSEMMKIQRLTKLIFWVLLCTLVSCKDGGRKSVLPAVTGSTNELLVVMPKSLWEGTVGDTVKHFFQQDQMGLPQSEAIFDVINLPPATFEGNIKAHRSVLIVSISNKVDSASMIFIESPWARTQKIFKIVAPSVDAFYKIFDENKEKMMGVFLKAERERLVDIYKKNSDAKIFDTFKNKYKMLLYCPGGYRINIDTTDFVWMSLETKEDSRGVIFFQEKYENESQLNYRVIADRVNDELKKYIHGQRDSTWMSLDMVTPMSSATYNYEGLYYAVLMKGLWTLKNDFMGGPFVLNVVIDEQNNRILYMMGYVYAPNGKKRNMLRQVESILFSMQFDLRKDVQAEK